MNATAYFYSQERAREGESQMKGKAAHLLMPLTCNTVFYPPLNLVL